MHVEAGESVAAHSQAPVVSRRRLLKKKKRKSCREQFLLFTLLHRHCSAVRLEVWHSHKWAGGRRKLLSIIIDFGRAKGAVACDKLKWNIWFKRKQNAQSHLLACPSFLQPFTNCSKKKTKKRKLHVCIIVYLNQMSGINHVFLFNSWQSFSEACSGA